MADMDNSDDAWLRRELDSLSASGAADLRVARCAHAYALALQMIRNWIQLSILNTQS